MIGSTLTPSTATSSEKNWAWYVVNHWSSKATLFFAGYACSILFRTASVRRRIFNDFIRNLPLGHSERHPPSITIPASRCQSSLLVQTYPTEREMDHSSELSAISALVPSCQPHSKALTTEEIPATLPRLAPVSKGLGLVAQQHRHRQRPHQYPVRVPVLAPE